MHSNHFNRVEMVCFALLFCLLAVAGKLVDGKGLSLRARKLCVQEHNRYRQLLAEGKVKNKEGKLLPQAANMNKLVYDKELEKEAERWAKNCPEDHDPALPKLQHGQNMFFRSPATNQLEAVNQSAKAWWDEVMEFEGTDLVLNPETFESSGHFTEMAQAKNTAVGCAIQNCKGGDFAQIVVCNYKTPNWMGESIYETGKPCSKCEGARKKCQNSLCV